MTINFISKLTSSLNFRPLDFTYNIPYEKTMCLEKYVVKMDLHSKENLISEFYQLCFKKNQILGGGRILYEAFNISYQ